MTILYSILVLAAIGAIGAIVLYTVAKKFHVEEDPRIAQVESILAGANCGGCGYSGCHDFASKCVEAGSLEGLNCPVSGAEGMQKIAEVLGCSSSAAMPNIAVVKCAGSSETKTPLGARFVGPHSCAVMNMTAGDYACLESCLGCGDCTAACPFGAITMVDGIDTPVVDEEICTGCGKCVVACPRTIIELRPKGAIKNRRVWVACSNCQKGALTRKQCTVGCIGCGLCLKACKFEAITITNNLAYIDPTKCKTCGKCIPVCPSKAIHSANIKLIANDEK